MKIYNTLSGQKEPFVPLEAGKVKMYVCGPTVYNFLHVGNMRCYVFFDTVRRYLAHKGYEVTCVQNFTDVDDKIIRQAQDEGLSPQALAEKYIAEALTDTDALGIARATAYPRVTTEMDAIIAMVARLIEGGFAYFHEPSGHVFFEARKAPGYGKLSKKNIDDLLAGARVEVQADKRSPMDFVLWKPQKPGEPAWDSPWGSGRPGWHIECSAMAKKYLGEEVDIHGGGEDLIFPHHENEIAQSECANGQNFVRFWMHNGSLTNGHKKMSKSLGNFYTLRELAQQFPHAVIRFFLLSGHYRMPMEFSHELLAAAQKGLARIQTCRAKLAEAASGPPVSAEADDFRQRFERHMDDDFNTADAISVVFELVRFANVRLADAETPLAETAAAALRATLDELCGLLGISLAPEETAIGEATEAQIEALIAQRQEARQQKNWPEADRVRGELEAMGVLLEDTREGVKWKLTTPPKP